MQLDRRPYPNETEPYRSARNSLLEKERELRALTEEVASLRRTLPLGGEIPEDYEFEELGSAGVVRTVNLSELFAEGQDSLFVYSFMFSPKMEQACPMCTSLLDGLNGNAQHVRQRISLAVSARSPIERIEEFARGRGWTNLRLVSARGNDYHRDYAGEGLDGMQWPMANVFSRRDGKVRHFWGSELLFEPFEGGNPRHVDTLWPLWNLLDLVPEGRGSDWYPSLSYPY